MMEALRMELDATRAGIGVSVFCPGPVNTNAHEISRNLSASFANAAIPDNVSASEEFIRQLNPQAMDPLVAGRIALEGIRQNQLYILTHPEFGPTLHERHEAIEASMPAPKQDSDWKSGLPSLYAQERDRALDRR
jgi:NAD(P)-dependent dehydrogenase (short-subunit alcohol dehydrogenase family)